MSRSTWKDLEASYHSLGASNLSVGEESLTDYNLLGLSRAMPPGVISIKKFTRNQEGREVAGVAPTGADWEWWFYESGYYYGLRIQAKKTFHQSYNTTVQPVYKMGPNATPLKQITDLIRSAQRNRCTPLYCFYNYWEQNLWRLFRGSNKLKKEKGQLGCTIAFANEILPMLSAATYKKGYLSVAAPAHPAHPSVASVSYPLADIFNLPKSRIDTLMLLTKHSFKGHMTLPHALFHHVSDLMGPENKNNPGEILSNDSIPNAVRSRINFCLEPESFDYDLGNDEDSSLTGIVVFNGDVLRQLNNRFEYFDEDNIRYRD